MFYLLLLSTFGCEAQQTRINLERNVYKRGINHSERAEFLYWHNYYWRQVENPQPSNMIYLLYHKELETAALDWAVKCNFQHANLNFAKNQLNQSIHIGRNIAVQIGGYSIQNAVFRWFNEFSDYSYKDKSCKPGAKCGHYEQVAGAVVTHIGCAVVYCPKYMNGKIVKEDAYNIVCDYYPSAIRSNWTFTNNLRLREKLSKYEQGQPCTACPDGHKVYASVRKPQVTPHLKRLPNGKLVIRQTYMEAMQGPKQLKIQTHVKLGCKASSSPTCLTLDNQCINPVNTTTCLCDASVYPVYHDSGQSPSFTQSSSPKQTKSVSVIESLFTTTAVTSRITDLPTTKSTKTVTAQVTSTKTSTFDSSSSPSLRSRTSASQMLHETATKISEVASTEAVKQISGIQGIRTESGTLEITQVEDRPYEITTSKTVLHKITTIVALPHITAIANATGSSHFGSGDNTTTAYQEQTSSEEMQPMCFIKISTRFLTQNDMLPKDPGIIGDELFQKRWRQIQKQPKLSFQVMDVVDSMAVPFRLLSVYAQHYNFMISSIACLIIRAGGCM